MIYSVVSGQYCNIAADEAFKLFDSLVLPILCYSSEIWGYGYLEIIEKVHANFCKRVCCLHQHVCTFLAISDCGRTPISIVYMSGCVNYWTRHTQMQYHRYPKQCYTMVRNLDNVGRVTGASHIRQLLFHTRFGYAWIANGVGSIPVFLKQFKNQHRDCSIQNLQSKINESSKSAYYKHYKSILQVEQYLSTDLPVMYKRAMSDLRCSGHCLMIENGRHFNLDKEYRYCPVCLHNVIRIIEDEMHFLLVCPLYNTLRTELFPAQWQTNCVCQRSFYNIMSDKNKRNIVQLSKYLYAFELRKCTYSLTQYNHVCNCSIVLPTA